MRVVYNIKKGLSHYSPPTHEIIAPHYGIVTIMGGGGGGYLTTKLGWGGGAIMGKTLKNALLMRYWFF